MGISARRHGAGIAKREAFLSTEQGRWTGGPAVFLVQYKFAITPANRARCPPAIFLQEPSLKYLEQGEMCL